MISPTENRMGAARQDNFRPYKGTNVKPEYVWLEKHRCWATVEPTSAIHRKWVEDAPWHILPLGWGSTMIFWWDLSGSDKEKLVAAYNRVQEKNVQD